MLIDAEALEYPDAPVNPYRKLLGMHLLPGNLKLDCVCWLFFFFFFFSQKITIRVQNQQNHE